MPKNYCVPENLKMFLKSIKSKLQDPMNRNRETCNLPVNEIKNFFFEIGWQKKQAFFDYILRGFVNEEQKQAYATTGWQERPLAKESNFFGREMGVHLKF